MFEIDDEGFGNRFMVVLRIRWIGLLLIGLADWDYGFEAWGLLLEI